MAQGRLAARMWVCLLVCVILPAGVGAQARDSVLRVTVQSGENPVIGAEVSIWDAAGRAAYTRTDYSGDGRLVFERPLVRDAYVLIRKLGYAVQRAAVPANGELRIVISPVTVQLPVLAVQAKPLGCP